jgi:hypothetical protein
MSVVPCYLISCSPTTWMGLVLVMLGEAIREPGDDDRSGCLGIVSRW